jgi:hypothetical protein
MSKAIGWFVLAAVVVLIASNAVYMLISPPACLQPSGRLGMTGSLSPERYAGGKGSIEVRALGAVILACIGWVICGYICR